MSLQMADRELRLSNNIIGTIAGLLVGTIGFFRAAKKANSEAMRRINERKKQP